MATARIREAFSLLGLSTDALRHWADDGPTGTITDAFGRLAVGIPTSRPARPSAPIGEARRAG